MGEGKGDEKQHEKIMQAAQIHLVVATLIMTVTFTAGFTLPGGFESDTNSPNKGMAILLRRTAFRAFVVTDAIAFTSSAAAVFTYFAMAASVISEPELRVVMRLYKIAVFCSFWQCQPL
ncbi:protein ACCELERATED CELL DEATH 6-like [Lycium barbarum]|uniref:protein ACCELERATED CELL DEATH 6-like n=1 Tax=Lycium barbarum TaxID=112863 RepID=UPI00293F76D3|nr:protein ACCELERATED CELL DEATH 6-like [Lycium barbarum]